MPKKKGRRAQGADAGHRDALVSQAAGVLGHSIYRSAKLTVKLAAGALVVIFGWLQLRGISFAPIAKDLSADVVLKSALALYYSCWVAGALLDTETQEKVYASQPNKGRMPIGGFGVILLLAAVFGVLCAAKTYALFSIALDAFLLLNVGTWAYMTRRLLPNAVTRSRQVYASAPLKLERIHLIYDRYLCGPWQVHRFITGGCLLAVLNVLVWSHMADSLASNLGLGSRELIISLVILCFVLVMEAWIWLVRLRIATSLALLEYLEERYGAALAELA